MADDSEVLIKIAADVADAVAAMRQVVDQMADMSKHVEDVGGASEKTEEQTTSFWTSMVEGITGSTTSSVMWGEQMSKAFDVLKEGVGDAIKAIPGMVTQTAEAGDKFFTLSNRLGVSVEALGEMDYIAKQSGASMQGMAMTVQGLGNTLQNEGSKGAKAIDGLGLNVKKLAEGKPEDAFYEIIEAIQGLKTPAEQNAKAMDIFGGRFRANTMLLRENIHDLRGSFEDLGTDGMSGTLAKAGDTYSDTLVNIELKQEAWRNQIGGALLPALNSLLGSVQALPAPLVAVGETLIDAGKSLLPMLTNVLLMKGPSGLVGLATDIGGMVTGAFEGLAVAIGGVTLPFIAGAAAVAALGFALYELLGGWDGIIEKGKAVGKFLEDLWVIIKHLTVEGIGALIAAFATVKGWFASATADTGILGQAINVVVGLFQGLWEMITKVWDKIAGFFSWMGKAVGDQADKYRALDATQEKHIETTKKVAEAHAEPISAMEKLTQTAAAVDDAYKKLTGTQGEQVKAMLAHGATSKEVADALSKDVGGAADVWQKAVDKFKKNQEDLKKAADTSPLAKLHTEITALDKALEDASKTGLTTQQAMDQLGKKASEAVTAASRFPGELAKVPPKVKELAAAWDAAQLAPKVKKVTDTVAAMAQAFHDKASAAVRATGDVVEQMQSDATAATLHGTDLRLYQIGREESAAMASIQARKAAAEADRLSEIQKIQAQYAQQIALETAANRAGTGLSEERRREIDAEAASHIDAVNRETEAVQTGLDAQRDAQSAAFDHKKRLETASTDDTDANLTRLGIKTKTAADEAVAIEEQKLAALKALDDPFYADQLRKQQAIVDKLHLESDAFEADMAARGVTTKAQSEARLQTQVQLLEDMKNNEWDFTAEAIAAQEAIVQKAREAAGQMSNSWGAAMGKMAGSVSSMGSAIGGTMGAAVSQGGGLMNTFSQVQATAQTTGKSWGQMSAVMDSSASGMSRATAGVAAAASVVQGVQGVMDATNKRTAGARALGGAMAGAQAGAAFGPYGMAIGAAAGLVVGLVRGKPAWAKATDEISTQFGAQVSDELGKAVADDAKNKYGGDRFTSSIVHIGDIIKEAGGITDKNAEQMTARLRDTFSLVETGKLKSDEGRKVLDENFGAFADHILKSNQVAGKGFQEIIQLNQSSGLKSEEVVNFVTDQTGRLGSALTGMFAPLTTNVQNYVDIQGQLANETDQGKIAALKDKLAAAKGELADSGEQMQRFENLSVAGFNAAIKGGVSYLDAMGQLSPALDTIVAAHKALGTEAGPAITELLRFREVTAQNPALVQSAASLNEVTMAMSNIGALNVDTLADLEKQGQETFDKLTAAGFSEGQSLQQMKGFLENVVKAHKDMGTPIDENTQKLVDQATEQGILAKDTMSANDIMVEGFGAIIEAVGGKIPEAFKKMKDAAKTTAKETADAVKDPATKAVDGLATAAGTTVPDALGTMTDAAKTSAEATAKTVTEDATAAVDKLGDAAGDTVPKKMKAMALESRQQAILAGRGITENATDAVNKLGDAAGDMVPKKLDAMARAAKVAAQATGKTITDDATAATNTLADAAGSTVPGAFDAAAKAATAAAKAVHDTVTTDATKSVTDLGVKIDALPFEGMATDAETAAQVLKRQMAEAAGAVGGVQTQLRNTDWAGWANAAVGAAGAAKESVDALSYGHSPGGIKDVPILLDQSTLAAANFAEKASKDLLDVKRQVDLLSSQPLISPEAANQLTALMKVQDVMAAKAKVAAHDLLMAQQAAEELATSGAMAAIGHDASAQSALLARGSYTAQEKLDAYRADQQQQQQQQAADAAQAQAAAAAAAAQQPLTFNFDINAIDTANMQAAVESTILPQILDTLSRGRNLTALRDLVR